MKQARTLTKSEIAQVVTHAATHRAGGRDRAIFQLAFATGMRACELASITVGHIRDGQGKVLPEVMLEPENTKGSKHGRIFLSTKVQKEMQFYLDACHRASKDTAPLFPSERRQPFSANTMTKLMIRTLAECGLKNATSHTPRRTLITNLANKAISIKVISTIARHSNVSTTSRYISVNDDQMRAAINMV